MREYLYQGSAVARFWGEAPSENIFRVREDAKIFFAFASLHVNFRSKSSRSLRFNNEAKRKFSLQFRLDFRNFASLHVASRRIAFAKRRLFHCLTIQPSLLRAENLSEEELKIRAVKEFDTIIHVWIKLQGPLTGSMNLGTNQEILLKLVKK